MSFWLNRSHKQRNIKSLIFTFEIVTKFQLLLKKKKHCFRNMFFIPNKHFQKEIHGGLHFFLFMSESWNKANKFWHESWPEYFSLEITFRLLIHLNTSVFKLNLKCYDNNHKVLQKALSHDLISQTAYKESNTNTRYKYVTKTQAYKRKKLRHVSYWNM